MLTRQPVRGPDGFVPAGGGGGGGGGGVPLGSHPPVPVKADPFAEPPKSKIVLSEQKMGLGGRHEEAWKRTPNTTGQGAIHVKSFHCKLATESLEYLDRQVNEWLDAHPQYEVKLVTTAVGEWTGKTKEPNLVVQVWV